MPLEKVVAQSQYMDIKPQQSGERNSERDDWTSHWTFDGAYRADQQSNWLRPGNEGIPPGQAVATLDASQFGHAYGGRHYESA
jgi:hypothetical protein